MGRSRRVWLRVAIGALLLGWTAPVLAGWVQIDQDGTRTLIQNGKVKEVPEEETEGWMIMDFGQQEILLVNPEQNTCARGSFDQYCDSIKVLVEAMQQAMAAFAGEAEEEEQPPRVQVKKIGAGGAIAGFETVKYQVLADGDLHEEIWLATDQRLMREIGSSTSLQGLAKCMQGLETEVESDPAYLDLITSGWALKEISYEMGEAEIDTRVVSLEKKEIPASEFTLPAGCRTVEISEIMGGGE